MDVEHVTLCGNTAFGKPVGRCIYCGSDGGLANNACLPKASCTNCAKQTSYLDDQEHTTMPNAKFFIDPTLAGAAGPYYNLFPVEPTSSATSSDWLKPDGKLVFP